MENNENMIEWLTNSKTAVVTFTNQKHINKITKNEKITKPKRFKTYLNIVLLLP